MPKKSQVPQDALDTFNAVIKRMENEREGNRIPNAAMYRGPGYPQYQMPEGTTQSAEPSNANEQKTVFRKAAGDTKQQRLENLPGSPPPPVENNKNTVVSPKENAVGQEKTLPNLRTGQVGADKLKLDNFDPSKGSENNKNTLVSQKENAVEKDQPAPNFRAKQVGADALKLGNFNPGKGEEANKNSLVTKKDDAVKGVVAESKQNSDQHVSKTGTPNVQKAVQEYEKLHLQNPGNQIGGRK